MSERKIELDFGDLGWLLAILIFVFCLDVTDDEFGQMGDAIACGIGGDRVCEAIQLHSLQERAERAAKKPKP